jgi:hypothetical protein
METKLKHLEFIQETIRRMASNSFLLKGWAVTLVSALFVLADKQAKPEFFYIAYIPTAVFWVLDGYYLSLERKFKLLYADVTKENSTVPSMSLDIGTFKTFEYWKSWWIIGIVRPATSLFYASLVVAMRLVILGLYS